MKIRQFEEEFRASAQGLLAAVKRAGQRQADSSTGIDHDVWEKLAQAGWFSVLVPEKDGGLGLGLQEMAAIASSAGENLLAEPYITHAVQLNTALCVCPEGTLRNSLLERLMAGRLIGALAWQEEMGQVDAFEGQIRTVCTRDGQHFTLSGTKRFVTPARGVEGWLVLAAGENGTPVLVWISNAANGISCRHYETVDGGTLSDVDFSATSFDQEAILAEGEDAIRAVNRANDFARIIAAADLIGVMDMAFQITLEYTKLRKQFGKAIASFQALKHKIVDCYIHIEIARACLHEMLDAVGAGATLSMSASRAKSRCAESASLVTRSAIQFHGAIGFTDECQIGGYLKRAMSMSAWLGGPEAHRLRYLTQYLEKPHESVEEVDVDVPSDGDWNSMSDSEFRQMLRTFYKRNYPQHMRNIQRRLYWSEVKDWTLTLSKQGWLAPGWPAQFGGMGLSPEKLIAFVEEQENYGVARTLDMGVVMVGPLLIKYGTESQQKTFLPKILTAEHRWCQGYSEPGSGSDLASLTTQAVLDGDEFVVNGQKIWTTLASNATHMFTLVRTDKNVKKQAGISFLLIDLSKPGVTVRPIRDIAGHEELCEVFLNDVRVPKENLVGRLNDGWSMAKALLGFERIFLGSPKQGRYALSQLTALAHKNDLFSNSLFATRYAELMLDVDDQAAGYATFAEILKRGELVPPSISLLKVWGTETYQKICVFLSESAQETGALKQSYYDDNDSLQPAAILFNAIPATIYGGSSEIQRDIIARHVLDIQGD